MPLLSIIFGILLDLVGIVGFVATGSTHKTALIPAVLGLILVICGIVVLIKPATRKHVMHVAALIGLLGFFGTIPGLIHLPSVFSGTAAMPAAIISKAITCVLSAIFLALCVKSFIDARRKKPENYGG